VKDKVMKFSIMIYLSIGVANRGVEHFGHLFWSSPEVKKEIKIFKDIPSNQNLYHILGLFPSVQNN
jgi:hypothetical protein